MTDEEIRTFSNKVACKYIENCRGCGNKVWETKCEKFEDQIKRVINIILKDYCIIPKDNARELARLTLEHGWSDDHGLIDGLVDWVCDNFNEEYREEAEK